MSEIGTTEEALLDQLFYQLKQGKTLLDKGGVKPGQVKMWTSAVRSRLNKIYGKESEIAKCFPTPKDKVPSDQAQEIFSQRLNKLLTFLESVQKAGYSSLCKAKGDRVFIGHGQSPIWRELKDFLSERLELPWDEFNKEAVAGYTTFERISEMLNNANFAFLIMTAEDEQSDTSIHARQNVVHEVGLFQGRLGPKKAIILLENGCEEFSNIVGLSQIRFPKGHISAAFEKIRRVLERENII